MPELLLALSGSALVQCPTVSRPKGKAKNIKQNQTILCLTSTWHTGIWRCSAMARCLPLPHSPCPNILLPAAQAYSLALLPRAQLPVLATSLIFIPTTWSCSYGHLLLWKTFLWLMNKCDMDQPPGWLPGPHSPSWDAVVLSLVFGA